MQSDGAVLTRLRGAVDVVIAGFPANDRQHHRFVTQFDQAFAECLGVADQLLCLGVAIVRGHQAVLSALQALGEALGWHSRE
ncbi:hypothetical protein D3C76_1759420 [compost metagenome]